MTECSSNQIFESEGRIEREVTTVSLHIGKAATRITLIVLTILFGPLFLLCPFRSLKHRLNILRSFSSIALFRSHADQPDCFMSKNKWSFIKDVLYVFSVEGIFQKESAGEFAPSNRIFRISLPSKKESYDLILGSKPQESESDGVLKKRFSPGVGKVPETRVRCEFLEKKEVSHMIRKGISPDREKRLHLRSIHTETPDFFRPKDETVLKFFQIFYTNPETAYFHCKAGMGRSAYNQLAVAAFACIFCGARVQGVDKHGNVFPIDYEKVFDESGELSKARNVYLFIEKLYKHMKEQRPQITLRDREHRFNGEHRPQLAKTILQLMELGIRNKEDFLNTNFDDFELFPEIAALTLENFQSEQSRNLFSSS